MAAVRKLASLARAARETRGLAVRQPVAKLQVAVPAAVKGRAFADLLDILAAEVNTKGVEVAGSDHELVRLKGKADRSEEHTSELQSQSNLVCRLLLEKKKTNEIRE